MTPQSSGTEEIEEVPCKLDDQNYVVLVDTPGFNDTNANERSDTQILAQIVDWMKASYGEKKLSGIIYLHSISDVRMTGASIQNLRMFRRLVGDDNLENVILTTTRWGVTPYNDAIRREEELRSSEGFWGAMIAGGSKIRRFENTEMSAAALVREVLQIGQETFVPKIQEEVVLQGKNLSATDAGAYIKEALVELSKKHDEEKEALQEELEWARKHREHSLALSHLHVFTILMLPQKTCKWSSRSRSNARS